MIWYMALAWWLVPCLPFPGLPHIYFLFTVGLRIFHVCCNENFRNSCLSFYWKKWFYIWYMALAWWLIPCLPFPGLPHIYFLFTVRLTNERVGVFLARRSVQHLVGLILQYSYKFTIIDILNLFNSSVLWCDFLCGSCMLPHSCMHYKLVCFLEDFLTWTPKLPGSGGYPPKNLWWTLFILEIITFFYNYKLSLYDTMITLLSFK